MPTTVAACASTAASFWITGCFHEDGLADAADGIGGGWTRKQILTIMTDTRLGTYGSATLILYTVTKLALLASLGPSQFLWGTSQGGGPALLASHCIARCTAPYLIRTRDYVDEMGPKSKYYSFMVQAKFLVSWQRVVFALLTGFVLALSMYGLELAIFLLVAMLVFAHGSGSYETYMLGGVMGDYLGATICLAELLVLALILAAQTARSDLVDVTSAFINQPMDMATLREQIVKVVPTILDRFREQNISTDEPLGVLLRFAATIIMVTFWRASVGETFEMQIEPAVQPKTAKSEKVDTRTFETRYTDAREYLDSLAKPVGSLGTLEDWAARLAAMQLTLKPKLGKAVCMIFAADHGAAKSPEDGGESCSAYPSIVTQSIVQGLERQVAGASVIGKQNNVTIQVLDVGVAGGFVADRNNSIVRSSPNKLQGGTKNLCEQSAMTIDECKRCIRIGQETLQSYATNNRDGGTPIVVLGEVGIGNTTSSAALISAIAKVDPKQVCGGGATVSRTADPAVVSKKIEIVTRALGKHRSSAIEPFQQHNDHEAPADYGGNPLTMGVLAALGGAEIAAMVGCILESSAREAFYNEGIPVVIDGYIVTAAALVAAHLEPRSTRVMFLATKSAEAGQAIAIESIQEVAEKNGILVPSNPALDMQLRLGEGSGGIMAVPILRSAAAVINDMATLKSMMEG